MRQWRVRTCVRLRLHDSGPFLHDRRALLRRFLHQLGLLQAEVQEMQAVVRPLALGQEGLRYLRFVQRADELRLRGPDELRLRDAGGQRSARPRCAGRWPACASG